MIPRLLRWLVSGAAAVVLLAGAVQIRTEDALLYLAALVVGFLVELPAVEVLPRVRLRPSSLAVGAGFVYIGGLPMLFFGAVGVLLTSAAREVAPKSLARRLPQLRLPDDADAVVRIGTPRWFAQESTAVLGNAARLLAATAVVSATGAAFPVWAGENAGAIAVGEIAGYATWAALAALPIFPDRSVYAAGDEGLSPREVMADMALIVFVLVIPFVFLMVYGYATAGVFGAASWGLVAALSNVVLAQLNARQTRVEEQNRRLEELNRELAHRERLSAVGQMSSVVSHQTLQQLGMIGIYANLVRNASSDGDTDGALARIRGHGEAIEGALDDVNRVLNDLLVFSRELRVNVYPHPVEPLLAEVVRACRVDAGSARVRLDMRCPDLTATFDKLKLRQVLENVVRNAIQASPPNGTVRISGEVKGPDLELVVEDDGPGVVEQRREEVFKPFFTTKQQGTGLGLAIAREFVGAHGGDVRVEARPGSSGARFVVRLPFEPR